MYNPDNVEMASSSLVEKSYEQDENSYKINSMKKDVNRYLNILPPVYKIEVIQYLKENFNLKEANDQLTDENTIEELEAVCESLSNIMSWPLELRKKFEVAKKNNELLDLKSTRIATMKIELAIEEAKQDAKSYQQKVRKKMNDLKLLKIIHNITIKEQKKTKENKG